MPRDFEDDRGGQDDRRDRFDRHGDPGDRRDEYDDEHDDEYDEDDRPSDDRIIQRAKDRIRTPAALLLVTGIIGAVMALFSIVNIFTMDKQLAKVEKQWKQDPNLNPAQKQELIRLMGTYKKVLKVGLPISIACSLITATITILGSIRLLTLSGKGLGMAGSILSMIPLLSGCCCMGLPVGIWVLIALGKPEVKAGFAAVARLARNRGEY